MSSLTVQRPNIRLIIVLVLMVHGLLALYVAWSPIPVLGPKVPRRPVVVRTVTLTESTSMVIAAAPPKTPAAAKPVQPVAKQPPKAQKKSTPVKSESKAKQSVPVSPTRTAALEKARASLAQLHRVEEGNSLASDVPIDLIVPSLSAAPIATNTEVVAEPSYSDELTTRLKSQLKLPEYGSVKVQLTVKRSGYVTNVEVLQSESQINRRYVEKGLSDLKFADFGKFFPGEEEHSFTLVLSNDM